MLHEMNEDNRARFDHIQAQLRTDTDNALTETEYYELSSLKYFCEEMEATLAKKDSMENVDKEILSEYLRAKENLMTAMRKYRDQATERKDSFGKIKDALIEFETKDGGMGTLEIHPKKEVIVVDLTDTGTKQTKRDKEDRR